ncbi:cell division protein FtsQ [Rhodococcus qingshengii]|jgi:cell division protein FtsQ|uniref:cell division protein FtsQ/DivIB n=1 Tax=Rhodococcus sp. TaxID=1831 RepID=UPI0008160E82|nr:MULTISPECIES: FtsQ-type POTRA domain-containing protein [Rhodococcus]SCC36329.1 cell division protein FtsQ [Rhodococcus qingshengii]
MTPDARSQRGRRDPRARQATSTRRRSTRTESRYSTRSTEPAPEPTPTRKWFKRPLIVAPLAIVLVVGIALTAWLSPVLSVRGTEVLGATTVSEEQILSLLAVPTGQPLMRVDTGAAAARVATIPKVASARVQRMYPSTIRVTVTERVPVVFVDSPEGAHLLDEKGVDFEMGVPPPGVPRLVTPTPGWNDEPTLAALEVLSVLPPDLRFQVGEVAARSISSVTLTLLDGRVVNWGGVEHSDRKAAVTLPLLTQPGQTYDVSSPDLPTVR